MTDSVIDGTDAAPTVEDPILELIDLKASYGPTRVLHGISMTVGRGEVVTLVGRNGAGKTTTLNSVLGNVNVTDGTIKLNGQDVTGLPADRTVKQGIAIVPEERRIFQNLTVEENLHLAALGGSTGCYRCDVDTVFEMFDNLRANRKSTGANLSGGEQQMLAIGRALVAGADVLMLDEPTEGLAPLIIERVESLIHELNDEGLTILLVEQNVEMAVEVADRAYIMDRGRIVWAGPADHLRDDDEVKRQYLGVSV